jgi:hypothetical protein
MLFRKTLERAVTLAASTMAAEADGALTQATERTREVIEPLRDDMVEIAFVLTAALVFLGACILIHAVQARPA